MHSSTLMQERPLVLELAGLAGAGKTALSDALGRRSDACHTGLGVYGLPKLSLACNVFRLFPFCVTLCGYRACSDERTKQMVRLRTLLQVLIRELSNPWRMIVLDEGPVFALSWLDMFWTPTGMDRGFRRWRRQAIQEWAARLDTIVWLDAPDMLLARRIRERAKGHPFKDKSDGQVLDFLGRFRASYERVISELTAGDGPKAIRFATDWDSPARIAEHLLDEVATERTECQHLV